MALEVIDRCQVCGSTRVDEVDFAPDAKDETVYHCSNCEEWHEGKPEEETQYVRQIADEINGVIVRVVCYGDQEETFVMRNRADEWLTTLKEKQGG